jgi:hypothetical protein
MGCMYVIPPCITPTRRLNRETASHSKLYPLPLSNDPQPLKRFGASSPVHPTPPIEILDYKYVLTSNLDAALRLSQYQSARNVAALHSANLVDLLPPPQPKLKYLS